MASKFRLLIDGEDREGSAGSYRDVLNPATGEILGMTAKASPSDIDDALRAAERGQKEWQSIIPWERGRIMKRAAQLLLERIDNISMIITREQGKPLAESVEEIIRSAEFLEWGGEEARRVSGRILVGRDQSNRVEVEMHPIGVVAAFTPWNFPMAQAAKKFAGALGAGCAIICKPSQEAPGSVLALARVLLDAGVPSAAIAVLSGESNEISKQLISSPIVAKVSFTGSIPVGKLLATASGQAMKPVTMELGGHAPVIVCKDVDPEATAEFLVKAKFHNAGQICLCPSRFYVHQTIFERFVSHFVERTKNIRVGVGTDPSVQMGPIISQRRLQAISELVNDARNRGATILTGGERMGNVGFFYAPTVLTNLAEDSLILHEEPFGPLAPIMPFSSEDEVLRLANGLEFGLSAYVFTHEPKQQRRIIDGLQYGAIGLNDVVTHHPEVPLGGWKESGIGAEGGIEILRPYLKTKFVSIR